MYLQHLELRNFRSYDHLSLDFNRPRTLIIGENGAGKSTIPDAIALALTGRCRGVNDRGEGQRELIRTGAEEAVVKLTMADNLDPIVVTIDQKRGAIRSHPVDLVLGRLRTTKPMLTAAIYGSTFFDMHHAEARNMLLRLLNVRVKVPVLPVQDGVEPGYESIDLDEADSRYRKAFEERAALKKALTAVHVPEVTRRVDLEQLDPERLQQQLREAKNAYEAVVSATAEVRAEAKQLTEEKVRLTRQPVDLASLRTKKETHESMLAEHQRQLTAAKAEVEQATEKADEPMAALDGRVHELKLFVQRVDQQAGQAAVKPAPDKPGVPSCVLGGGIPCLTPAGEFASALETTKREIAKLEKRIKAGTKAAEALAAAKQSVKNAEQNVTYHQGQIDSLARTIAGIEQSAARILEIEAALVELQPHLASGEDHIEQATSELARLQTQVTELATYRQALKNRETGLERQAQLTEDVKDAETLVQLLGPTGARATALQAAVDDFHQAINAALGHFGFELGINVDPWRVLVTHRNSRGALPFQLLSKGERIWTGLAFQLALAAVSGLDFCLVDDAEGVVGRAMQVMTALVMAAPVGQVLVIKAQANQQSAPEIDGLQIVHVLPGLAELPAGATA